MGGEILGSRKLTLEEVKSRLAEISPTIEILSDAYVNNETKLNCKCKTCGNEWSAVFASLQSGTNCPKCFGGVRLTLDFIKEEFYKLNPDAEILNEEYINNNTPLTIRCKIDGKVWYKTWNKLRSSPKCSKCTGRGKFTLDEIKDKLKLISPTLEILSDSYTNAEGKLDVKCSICGHEWKTKWSHLNDGTGCKPCSHDDKRLSIDYIVSKLESINENIKILDTVYVSAKSKLKCKCLICDETWSTTWDSLQSNHGCPQCSIDSSGWTKTKWINRAQLSRNFDSFKLYVLRCYNDTEIFYKIGITFTTVKSRYFRERDMPYNYEIITILESDDARMIWSLEKELHSYHRKHNLKYKPLIAFGGSETECFTDLLDITQFLNKESEV